MSSNETDRSIQAFLPVLFPGLPKPVAMMRGGDSDKERRGDAGRCMAARQFDKGGREGGTH